MKRDGMGQCLRLVSEIREVTLSTSLGYTVGHGQSNKEVNLAPHRPRAGRY